MRIKVTNEDGEHHDLQAQGQTQDFAVDADAAQTSQGDLPAADISQELTQTQDKYLRALADLDNYRKRYDRELVRMREQDRERMIKELLPVADSLERAVSTENASTSPWFEGLMAVRRQMEAFLRGYGVAKINVTRGEHFNPVWHEAVATLAMPDTPQGVILDVAEAGYKMGERVLRPARVIVASGS
ncbi:MAG TPA: nucleotide exchange factor GrpE [Capsulimonadaceae bacterium]|nr:nucleotide exchange factor GrpE [Capsulimonadaceae bacterium]